MTIRNAKRRVSSLLAITLLMAVICPSGAQALGGSASNTSAQRSSSSVSIQIVAYVPPVVKLDLDFSDNGSVRLAGYSPGSGTFPGGGTQAGQTSFALEQGATVSLGTASLFSNILGSYSIVVQSANGGYLRDSMAAESSLIPYQLNVGSQASMASHGSFTFTAGGKSGKHSPYLPVSITIGEVPESTHGKYSDQLVFSIVAG